MVNTLRESLRAGRRIYGTLVASNSPLWPSLIKRTGIDFVFIDTEHIALDHEAVSWMCRAYGAMNISPIVRIPSLCPIEACKVLDGGAHGVVAPYVETAEQAKILVGAVKLSPLKGERLRQVMADRKSLEPSLQHYMDQRNARNLCIVNIESIPAIENLDDILAVDGLDAVLIGPHDLSCSLGIPEQYHDPSFKSIVEQVIRKARAAGIAAGIHMVDGDVVQELAWAQQGANFILHSGDAFMIEQSLRHDIHELRTRLGDDLDSSIDGVTAI